MKDISNFLNSGTFATGVNYWASHAATQMWSKWDETVVEEDFKVLADHGIQILRVFPIWPDFQPICTPRHTGAPGGIPWGVRMGEDHLPETELGRAGLSEVMMERFERFTQLADKYEIKLLVALLTGHMTGRVYVPPALEGRDLFKDPFALKWQKRFIKGFVSHFKNNNSIAAWSPGNECSCMSEATSPEVAWFWMSTVCDAIRAADPTRPVVAGLHGLRILPGAKCNWLIEDMAELADILTPHPYPCFKHWAGCDPCNTIRYTFHSITEKHFYTDIGKRPSLIEEIGTYRPMYSNKKNHADMIRNLLWNNWAHDSLGMFWWCAFDQDQMEFLPYDETRAGLEHGLFSIDREPIPAAKEYQSFRKMIDELPFETLPKAKTDAVCILDGEACCLWDFAPPMLTAMILSQQAGFNIEFHDARKELKDSNLYLIPCGRHKVGLPITRWKELREKVKKGATLYMSLDDCYLDDIANVFSAEIIDRKIDESIRKIEFKFSDNSSMKLKLSTELNYSMETTGANVIGQDNNGMPVFFEGQYGLGKVFLLTFPLERLLSQKSGSFQAPETCDSWKIYSVFAKEVINTRIMTKTDPFVTITEHKFDAESCVCIIVNNSPESRNPEIKIADGWRVREIHPRDKLVEFANLEILPNSGLVVMLEKCNHN